MSQVAGSPQKRKYIKNYDTEIDSQHNQESKKTRNSFSFKEKATILGELETESTDFVSKKYGVHERLLRKWKAKKTYIIEAAKSKDDQNRRKNRSCWCKDLDDALYFWFLQPRESGIAVSGPLLKDKALSLNSELGGPDTFKASEGWLDRWKKRKGIQSLKITGEKQKSKNLKRSQVFNFDETGLYYK